MESVQSILGYDCFADIEYEEVDLTEVTGCVAVASTCGHGMAF